MDSVHEAFWFKAQAFGFQAEELVRDYSFFGKRVLPAGQPCSMDLEMTLRHVDGDSTLTFRFPNYLTGSEEDLQTWKQVQDSPSWVASQLDAKTLVGFTDRRVQPPFTARRLKGGLAHVLSHPNCATAADMATTLAVDDSCWDGPRLRTGSGLEFHVVQ